MTGFGQICRQLEHLAQAVRAQKAVPAGSSRLIAEVHASAASLPLPPWPEGLVGRPSADPPAVWHATCLRHIVSSHSEARHLDGATCARVLYHLNWLRWHFSRQDVTCLPRVSIVIPTYNRADLIGPTLESCLAQTAPSVEVVVTDDGSTDDIDTALRPYIGRIVLLRQENRGISHARRAGIEAATGDFVHLLDSDDFLLPDCLSDRLAEFAAVPDASLCYGGLIGYDPDIVRKAFGAYENPDGGALCPTTDFLRSIMHRLPFLPSVVMMPRWVLLDLDAFHEGLRRGEDTRLWFTLAMRRPKVIGSTTVSAVRRYHASSLGQHFFEPSCSHAISMIMNLCDLLADPGLWSSGFQYLHAMALTQVWQEANTGEAPDLLECQSRLIAGIAALGDGQRVLGHSPAPVIVLLLAGLRTLSDEMGIADQTEFTFHRALVSALATAARTVAPLADEDVAIWLTSDRAGLFDRAAVTAFADLSEELQHDTNMARLVPAARLLLNLASPAFDPETFGPKTLARLDSSRVAVRSSVRTPAPAGVSTLYAAVLDRIPIGSGQRVRRDALELLDRVTADGPWSVWRNSVRDLRRWKLLDRQIGDDVIARVHRDALHAIIFAGSEPKSDDRLALHTKAGLHARAIARALGSTEPRHETSLAVLIAAADPRGLEETIESALAITACHVEVIIAGDRDDAGLAACLAPYAGKVRFLGRVRPKPAAACNLAISYAGADFVVVVEAGSILDANGVAAHLAALQADPLTQLTTSGHSRSDSGQDVDLLADVVAGDGPTPGAWMAPRWFVLDTGPVDTWLPGHEFGRYAFRMALRKPVVARVQGPSAARPGRNLSSAGPSRFAVALVDMLNLADLLAHPDRWDLVPGLVSRMNTEPGAGVSPGRDAILYGLVAGRLCQAIGSVRQTGNAIPGPLVEALAVIEEGLKLSRVSAGAIQDASAPRSL